MSTEPKASGVQHEQPPAPAARAESEELSRMVEETTRSPLFAALLDWIDGHVLVLNPQRQIVMASPELAPLLGIEGIVQLVGCRPGEALGCVHSAVGPGGCGTSQACRYCGALGAILKSLELSEPIESECRIRVRGEGGPETTKYRVRASRARSGEWDFTVLVLQAQETVRPAQSGVRQVVDWPIDLAQYSQIRRLGKGGMGSVFLVRDGQGREVALKTIREGRALDEEVAERFLREIRIGIVLDHPNIIKTYRADQTATGSLYMVSEYCPGGDLYHWLQRHGPLPLDVALYWLHGAVLGLDYAWREHRLMHRDIKPDNILLDADGHAKIADFGLAKRAGKQDARLTKQAFVLGTALYMAPEQAAGRELDIRADLYSLGATFYELLSGRPPIEGPNPSAVMTAKLATDPPLLCRARGDLPEEVGSFIDWLLARRPSRRPDDPGQALDRLHRLIRKQGIELYRVQERLRSG